ncbi:MAG: hypothetical protein IJB83_02915 [Bacilli bacterium]|nr:hypothetical protein [Bacilli bacterium]
MDKYKINYIFNEEKDINDILIIVLNKKLKKYIQMICKNDKSEVASSCTYLSLEGGKNC